VVVSDTEVDRGEHGEVGYMVDTLLELQELPAMLGYHDLDVSLSLVVGADQAATLPSWYRFEQITKLAGIVVVRRPDQLDDAHLNSTVTQLDEAWEIDVELVDMPSVPISSTHVREVARSGDREALRALVPDAILDDVLRLYGPDAP
jgi:nicotinic acid mononucleotide adenylyltransferase